MLGMSAASGNALYYAEAIPVLLVHLALTYPARVREGIARALAVRGTKAAGWNQLTRLYRAEPQPGPKDGMAAAIAACADDEVLDDIIELVCDVRNGPSRLLLLSALERSNDPRGREVLIQLSSDGQLVKETRVILRRLDRSARRSRKRP